MRQRDQGSFDESEPAWEAQPKQQLYISCPFYEVGYFGERASGKTDALLMEPIVNQYLPADARFRTTGKKSRGWVLYLRKEFGRLREVIERAKELFPRLDPESMKRPGFGWVSQERTYRFTNGFRYEFGHLEDPDSHNVYHGRQFSRVIVDEAPEIPFYQYSYLFSVVRVRQSDEQYLQTSLGIRCSGNPYGPHVDWVKKRFIDIGPFGFVDRSPTTLPDGQVVIRERVAVQALLKDNKFIDYASYASSMADLPEHMRQAFLYGNWDYVTGAYFVDFNKAVHTCEAFGVPPHWAIERGGDWGSREPACCLWYTKDNDNNLIILDELYGPGITGADWADVGMAREAERGWTDTSGYLDPGAWADHGSSAPSPGDEMLSKGWLWYPADKTKGSIRMAAIELTRRLRMMSPSGVPGILISTRCPNLMKQIAAVRKKDDAVDEFDFEKMREDHAWEALRAILLANTARSEANPSIDLEVKRWEKIARAKDAADRRRREWY